MTGIKREITSGTLRTILVDEIYKGRDMLTGEFYIGGTEGVFDKSDFDIFNQLIENRNSNNSCTCLVKFTDNVSILQWQLQI